MHVVDNRMIWLHDKLHTLIENWFYILKSSKKFYSLPKRYKQIRRFEQRPFVVLHIDAIFKYLWSACCRVIPKIQYVHWEQILGFWRDANISTLQLASPFIKLVNIISLNVLPSSCKIHYWDNQERGLYNENDTIFRSWRFILNLLFG